MIAWYSNNELNYAAFKKIENIVSPTTAFTSVLAEKIARVRVNFYPSPFGPVFNVGWGTFFTNRRQRAIGGLAVHLRFFFLIQYCPLHSMRLEEWVEDITKDVFLKWKSDYSFWRPGFKVFFGPVRKIPMSWLYPWILAVTGRISGKRIITDLNIMFYRKDTQFFSMSLWKLAKPWNIS